MNAGIVILNYNSYNLTCELVKKVLEIDLLERIVLIDNCSKDDFTSFCKDLNDDRVKYIKNTENTGYASGNNIGLKYLKNEGFKYAFIANPDVILEYSTIKNILAKLKNNDKYGIISCKRTQNGTKNTAQFWKIPNYVDSLFESVFLGRKIQGNINKKRSNKICETIKEDFLDVDVVGGAFFGCNLEIMSQINYLDENTFLWYEENIVSYKLREKNYKVGLLKNCSYEHNHAKKGHGNKMHKVFLKSKKHYCYKYLKINKLQKILLFMFDYVGIIENNLICLLNRG